jgi:hypothetical protein
MDGSKQLVRAKNARRRLDVGKTFFDQLVKAGKLKMFKIGPRATACLESDLNDLIEGFARGEAEPPKTTKVRYVRG